MKKRYSILLLCLASIPFMLELPYACQAMRVSSAERWNWGFVLWAALLAVSAFLLRRWKEGREAEAAALREVTSHSEECKTQHSEKGRGHTSAWRYATVLPPLILLLFGYVKHIHLAVLVGGIFLPYMLAGCLLGWRKVLQLLPSCCVLLFFCPSIGVFLSTIFMLDGLLLKAFCALVFTLLTPCLVLCKIPRISFETLAFGGIALLIACCYWVRGCTISRHPSLLPVFDNLVSSGFRGIEEEISATDRHFFGDSDIKRFLFTDPNGNTIQVLVVSKIDNIHQIHPTAYCLRVGGFHTQLEHSRRLQTMAKNPLAEVLETLAERSEEKRLYWQWFSTPEYSTSNFLLFRTLYSPANDWSVFIIDMPLNGTLEEGQKILQDFISVFTP